MTIGIVAYCLGYQIPTVVELLQVIGVDALGVFVFVEGGIVEHQHPLVDDGLVQMAEEGDVSEIGIRLERDYFRRIVAEGATLYLHQQGARPIQDRLSGIVLEHIHGCLDLISIGIVHLELGQCVEGVVIAIEALPAAIEGIVEADAVFCLHSCYIFLDGALGYFGLISTAQSCIAGFYQIVYRVLSIEVSETLVQHLIAQAYLFVYRHILIVCLF